MRHTGTYIHIPPGSILARVYAYVGRGGAAVSRASERYCDLFPPNTDGKEEGEL